MGGCTPAPAAALRAVLAIVAAAAELGEEGGALRQERREALQQRREAAQQLHRLQQIALCLISSHTLVPSQKSDA